MTYMYKLQPYMTYVWHVYIYGRNSSLSELSIALRSKFVTEALEMKLPLPKDKSWLAVTFTTVRTIADEF